jgi:ketosteroid isomerase-like protein
MDSLAVDHGRRQEGDRMSEVDLAVVRRFHGAWTAGDIDAALALVDPDVVAHPLHGVLYSRMEYRGHDGIKQWYREMTGPWDRYEAIVEEVRETPDGRVMGTLRLVGYRGEEPFHARVGAVFGLRDGRIVSMTARNVGDVEDEMRAL